MRIVCLANSTKDGGLCLAGARLNQENQPLYSNNQPIFIRPVSNLHHQEIPENVAYNIKVLDILEFDVIEEIGEAHQSENVLIEPSTLKVDGSFDFENIDSLILNKFEDTIFTNSKKNLSEKEILNCTRSLIFVRLDEFEAEKFVYNSKNKIEISFKYGNEKYKLKYTNYKIINNIDNIRDVINSSNQIYVMFSLPKESFENPNTGISSYYKIIASVISPKILSRLQI